MKSPVKKLLYLRSPERVRFRKSSLFEDRYQSGVAVQVNQCIIGNLLGLVIGQFDVDYTVFTGDLYRVVQSGTAVCGFPT